MLFNIGVYVMARRIGGLIPNNPAENQMKKQALKSLVQCGIPALSLVLFGASAFGANTETDQSSGVQTNFDANILNNDLIENGSSTLSGAPLTTGSIAGYTGQGATNNSWNNLTDGLASTKVTTNDLSNDTFFDAPAMDSGASITYSLNTSAHPLGFTLNTIQSIDGWADTTSFSNQKWSVYTAPVNSPNNFTLLASVNYAPFSGNGATPNSSQVTLSNSVGTGLVSNVGQIKLSIADNGGTGQVFREFDVTGVASTTTPPPPPPVPATIMPLGDSITYGDQTNPSQIPGGYRTQLYSDLHAANYAFNFVGSQTGNPSATLTAAGQVNNEGHNGYRIDQILNNLDSSDGSSGNNGGYWLSGGGGTGRSAVLPTQILLHIGTNDILQHWDPSYSGTAPEATFMTDLEGRLNILVTRIFTDSPASTLFISNIIPIANHTNANGVDENTEVKAYNTYIQQVLYPHFEALGDSIDFVDQYDNFVNSDGSIKTALFPDNVHPTQAGYNTMGDTWASAVLATPEPGSLSAIFLVGAVALLRRRRGTIS
jgi:lysophospholipase L1-like esterase